MGFDPSQVSSGNHLDLALRLFKNRDFKSNSEFPLTEDMLDSYCLAGCIDDLACNFNDDIDERVSIARHRTNVSKMSMAKVRS